MLEGENWWEVVRAKRESWLAISNTLVVQVK